VRRILRWLCGLPLLALGCGSERPACAPEALVALEGAYVAEVMAACPGASAPEQCPEYNALRDKYAARRKEWEACR
jgi:hypothetical protein